MQDNEEYQSWNVNTLVLLQKKAPGIPVHKVSIKVTYQKQGEEKLL